MVRKYIIFQHYTFHSQINRLTYANKVISLDFADNAGYTPWNPVQQIMLDSLVSYVLCLCEIHMNYSIYFYSKQLRFLIIKIKIVLYIYYHRFILTEFIALHCCPCSISNVNFDFLLSSVIIYCIYFNSILVQCSRNTFPTNYMQLLNQML